MWRLEEYCGFSEARERSALLCAGEGRNPRATCCQIAEKKPYRHSGEGRNDDTVVLDLQINLTSGYVSRLRLAIHVFPSNSEPSRNDDGAL